MVIFLVICDSFLFSSEATLTIFSGDCYKSDINATNPLGFSGRLATVFADFMKQMWNGLNRVYEPTKIKVAFFMLLSSLAVFLFD